MPDKTLELLGISRLLSPEHQADLLTWAHLAYKAEKSVKKSLSLEVQADVFSLKTQDYFCEKTVKGRKK